MNREKNFISAVVYVRNARGVVGQFVQAVARLLRENFEHAELIFVNDGSTDGSAEEIRERMRSESGVTATIVNLSYYHGVESAMAAGNSLAIGDYIFEFDAPEMDWAADVAMEVYRKALEGYDIVSAVPDTPQRMTSRLFYWAMQRFAERQLPMRTERFRVLSRRAYNRIEDANRTVPYRKVAYAGAGLRMASVAYPVSRRIRHEASREERRYRRRLATDTLLLFTDVGYRLSSGMALTMMVVAVLMAAYCAIVYLSAAPVAGWTTTVLFLSLGFFGVFGVLTVITKYLQLILSMVFHRKQFSFQSIEKISQ